ncbi:uncharacterized protein LOC144645718 [Oculina patagonica]
MNFKTTIVIVLVSVLTTAICSDSGGSDEYMPYRQLLRELRKKGTGVRRRLDQAVSVKSKRTLEDNCDAFLAPCSQYTCSAYTCEDVQLACNTATSQCEPGESSSYRR